MVDLINPVESYLVDLLQGYISVDGVNVEVIKHRPEPAHIPCITLDVQDISTDGVYRAMCDGEQLVYERSTTIQLDVWSYDELQRQSINRQVLDCWYKEQNQHYRYCTQYSDGICSTTGEDCQANSVLSNRCPYTERLGYEPLMLKHGLLVGGLNIEPPFDLDEFEEKPPVLHSVFRCIGAYREFIDVRAKQVEDVDFGVEIK